MKLVFSIFLVLVSAQLFHGQTVDVPEKIRTMLTTYRGWRLATVDAEIRKRLERREVGVQPNLITGDFDGDGNKDYAMFIEWTDLNEPDKSLALVTELNVFLRRGDGYESYLLGTPLRGKPSPSDSMCFLTLSKKGEKGSELESGKDFIYPTDSISSSCVEKTSGIETVRMTRIYENGTFHFVTESR